MSLMFYKADAFNQDIDGWDVSKVTDKHPNHQYLG
jgi:surface protein